MFNNVNRSDARAALKVLYDILGEKRGYLLDSSVDIIDSLTEIKALLQSHSIDVVTLSVEAIT